MRRPLCICITIEAFENIEIMAMRTFWHSTLFENDS